MIKKTIFLWCAFCCFSAFALNPNYLDIPECRDLPVLERETLIGLTWPVTDVDLAVRGVELSLLYDDVNFCQQHWDTLLPIITPWARKTALERYYGYAVYAFAFVLCFIAYVFFPFAYRRYFTLSHVIYFVAGTWLVGAGILMIVNQLSLPQKYIYQDLVTVQFEHYPERWQEVDGIRDLDRALIEMGLKPVLSSQRLRQSVDRMKPTDSTAIAITTALGFMSHSANPVGHDYAVRQPLNFRAGPGVEYPKLGKPLSRGTKITVIGPVKGDWWRISVQSQSVLGATAPAAGYIEGWVSSLWLANNQQSYLGGKS